MPFPAWFVVASFLLAPVPGQDPEVSARVRELLEDLSDATVARAAAIELDALGVVATPTLIARALDGGSDQALVLPYLRASEATARVALDAVLARADQVGEPPAGRPQAALSLAAGKLWLARRLAADLAPYVPDAATVCASLLRLAAATDRLSVRCRFAPTTTPLQLAAALTSDQPAAVEVALELLARAGPRAAAACATPLAELFDGREALYERLAQHDTEVRSQDVSVALAAAVLAVLPGDRRTADACVELLQVASSPAQRIELLERLSELGADAAPAVAIVQECCYVTDDLVCRAALDALGRLGATAAPALATIEERAQRAADPETRRLAQVALARVTNPDDVEARVDALVHDLAHQTRWRRARAELVQLGEPAAHRVFALLGDPDRRDAWPLAVELLHDLGAAGQAVAYAQLAHAPRDFAHATWLRLRVAVDLLADRDSRDRAAQALAAWPTTDADVLRRAAALQARLDALATLARDSDEPAYVAALAHGGPAVVERAARLLAPRGALLAQRGDATRELVAALTTALTRVPPDFAANEEALACDGFALGAVATTLFAYSAAPPLAFAVLADQLTLGPLLELVRRVPDLGWSPDIAATHLQRMLADRREDVQIAAADALVRLGPAAGPAVPALERLARTRSSRALERALKRALRAAKATAR